jgi:hypothetical protein
MPPPSLTPAQNKMTRLNFSPIAHISTNRRRRRRQSPSLCYLSANHPCDGVVIARMDYTTPH